MTNKWLLRIGSLVLALSLITGCATNDNNNEPNNDAPLDQNEENQDNGDMMDTDENNPDNGNR